MKRREVGYMYSRSGQYLKTIFMRPLESLAGNSTAFVAIGLYETVSSTNSSFEIRVRKY